MRERGDERSEAAVQVPVAPAGALPGPAGAPAAGRALSAAQLLGMLPPAAAGTEARGAQVLARAVRVRAGGARLARIFERADASRDTAGAEAAVREFQRLTPAARESELAARYPSSEKLAMTLNQLGRTASGARSPVLDPALAGTVTDILRFVEETAIRTYTGKSDKELAALQEAFLKAKAAAKTPAPPGWGGTTPAKTRWKSLTGPERTSWTTRGEAAIKKMAAFCAANDPELGVVEASFELKFAEVDVASLGAIATVGSRAGKTIQVGFEFVVAVEMDPRYALSTVVHELYGHPAYDRGPDDNASRALYLKSIAKLPGKTVKDRSGSQTYSYWPSEIYSLVKEFHYFTPVSAADAAKSVALPTSTTTMDHINYPPTGGAGVKHHLRSMQKNWDPVVLEGILRGLFERFRHDPTIYANSLVAYKAAVEDVFGATVAARISK